MGTYCFLLLAAVVAAAVCDDRVEIVKGRTDNSLNNNRRTRPLEAGTDFDAHSPYDIGGHHKHGMHRGGHHMHGMHHGGHHMHGMHHGGHHMHGMHHGGHHMQGRHHGHRAGGRSSHHGPHHGPYAGSQRRRGGHTGMSSLGGRLAPENRPLDPDGRRHPMSPDNDMGGMGLGTPHHRRMMQTLDGLDGGNHIVRGQGRGTDDASSLDMRFAGMGRGNPGNLDDGDFKGRRGHHTGSRRGHRGHGHQHGGHHEMHHGGIRIQYGDDDSATSHHRRLGPRYRF